MSAPAAVRHVPEARARAWARGTFGLLGMRDADAAVVADNLVDSDLRGVFSHGLMRVPSYAARLRAGATDARATPRTVDDAGAVALVDGCNAMGPVVGAHAMREAIERAREHGVAWVGVRDSNHYGACAVFALMAAREGMIGLTATVSANNIMAPWGALAPLLGNNPFAIAVPAGAHPPLVLDIALSVAARGKIMLALRDGHEIPDGWALDAAGRPTVDPATALAGLVRPLGDHKGSGLSLMVGVLAGLLNGAAFGASVTDLHADLDRPQNVGHLMLALDVARLAEPDAFAAAVDAAIELVHAAPRADGVERVLVPGELEEATAARQRAAGIVYPSAVVAELDELGDELGGERLAG